MRTEKNSKAKPRKKTSTRILKLVLAVMVVLIVLVLFLVPAFVSSEKGRQIILARINNSIDGQTDFADLSMGWFKGIKVADVSFSDSVGWISVHVRQIATKPHYGSILTGNLSFGETIIDEPKVHVNLKSRQIEQTRVPDKKPRVIAVPIKNVDLVVHNGNFKVTDRQAKSVELSQINSKVDLRPPGQQTNFDVNMAVVAEDKSSKVRAVGRIEPGQAKTGWTLKGTTGDLTVEVNDLELESLAPFFALAGVEVQAKGLIGGRVNSQIKDGRLESLSAGIKGKNLDITGAQLKGDRLQTGGLDVGIKLNRQKETINIEDLQIESDWASVTASGVVPTTFKSFTDFFQADSNYSLKGSFNCDLAAVLSQMPKTLGLKEGTQITSGQLSGNVDTSTRAGQKQIQAQGTVTRLEGTVEGKKIALSQPIRAQAQISSKKNVINFDKLDVSAPFAKIKCTGTSELLKYDADVNLAKLQSELGQFINIGQYQMAGELLGNGQLSIKENKITTSGSSVVKNLRLSSKEKEAVIASEPMADVAFAFDIDTQDNIITVDSVKASATLGQIDVKDAVVPLKKGSAKPLHLPISANNVDLQKLQPFAVLFASFPKEMQLAGIANSDISVSSEKDIYKITTDSTKIKNLKFSYPGQKPFESNEASLVFDAEVDPGQKTINVKKLQLESPQIKIYKREFSHISKAGKTKLQGRVECEYDLSAVNTIAAPFLPRGLKAEGKRKDTISFASEYPTGQTDQILPNLNAKAKLGFEKAYYMGLNFGPTDVDIQIQNGLLKTAPFATTVNDGQFNFAGQVDFKQKPVLLKTTGPMQIMKDIKINDETTRRLLMYLNPIFANAVNVSGVANFNCQQLTIPLGAAARKQTEVTGTISIGKLRLQASDLLNQILLLAGTTARGVDMAIRPTNFSLRNGFLRYDDMQIDIGDKPFNFKGVIGLDKSLDMTVTLPYTTEGRTVRLGKEVVGERISPSIKGTIDKPQLDIDMGKLLEGQLKKPLDELRKGLEELFK